MITSDILDMYKGLSNLKPVAFPAKVAYAIMRNQKICFPIVEDFNNVQIQVVSKYGVQNSDEPGVFSVPNDKMPLVDNELGAVLNTDNPQIDLMKIRLSDLDGLNLTIEQMQSLYPMISEEV